MSILSLLAAAVAARGAVSFDPPAEPKDAKPHARLSLKSDQASALPGSTIDIAFSLELEPTWHTYWRGPSDTGMAPTFELTLPAGWSAGEPQWPTPERLVGEGDVLDHVYEHSLTVIYPVHVAAGAKPGETLTVQGAAKWLVCNEVCVPERGTASVSVRIGPPTAGPATDRAILEQARARHAKPIKSSTRGVTATRGAEGLHIDAPGATMLTFIPDRGCEEAPDLLRQGEAKGPALRIRLAGEGPVKGIIEAKFNGGAHELLAIDLPAEKPPSR